MVPFVSCPETIHCYSIEINGGVRPFLLSARFCALCGNLIIVGGVDRKRFEFSSLPLGCFADPCLESPNSVLSKYEPHRIGPLDFLDAVPTAQSRPQVERTQVGMVRFCSPDLINRGCATRVRLTFSHDARRHGALGRQRGGQAALLVCLSYSASSGTRFDRIS